MTRADKWRTFLYALIVAVSVPLIEALVMFDPETIVSWQSWATGIGVGMTRAGAGFLMVYLIRPHLEAEHPANPLVADDYPNERLDERVN